MKIILLLLSLPLCASQVPNTVDTTKDTCFAVIEESKRERAVTLFMMNERFVRIVKQMDIVREHLADHDITDPIHKEYARLYEERIELLYFVRRLKQ